MSVSILKASLLALASRLRRALSSERASLTQPSPAQCSLSYPSLSYPPGPPSTPHAAPPPSASRRLPPPPAAHSPSVAHTSPAHSPASRPAATEHPPAAPALLESCWSARAVAAAAAQCARLHPPSPAPPSERIRPPLPGSATPARTAHTVHRPVATLALPSPPAPADAARRHRAPARRTPCSPPASAAALPCRRQELSPQSPHPRPAPADSRVAGQSPPGLPCRSRSSPEIWSGRSGRRPPASTTPPRSRPTPPSPSAPAPALAVRPAGTPGPRRGKAKQP